MSDTFVKVPGLFGYQRVVDPDADCGGCEACLWNATRRADAQHFREAGQGYEALGADKPCQRKALRQREALGQVTLG